MNFIKVRCRFIVSVKNYNAMLFLLKVIFAVLKMKNLFIKINKDAGKDRVREKFKVLDEYEMQNSTGLIIDTS